MCDLLLIAGILAHPPAFQRAPACINNLWPSPVHSDHAIHAKPSTGVPFTPVVGFDRTLLANNFTGSLPNVVAGCDPYANQSRIRWFNAACFTLPEAGTIGNAGRNSLVSPGYAALDVNVSKDTKLTEGTTLQFRAEFFNILNHTNFNVPAQGIFNTAGTVNANQGTITSIIGTSRQIQFGLKLLF